MRKAYLLLHRKIERKAECICGGGMKLVNHDWICDNQYARKEDNIIPVVLKGVRRGLNWSPHPLRSKEAIISVSFLEQNRKH